MRSSLPPGYPDGPNGPTGPAGPATQPATGTGLLEREATQEQVEPGDHERYAHYVRKDKILASAVSGRPVIALCGKVWTPGRDPNKFPICPACKAIYDGLRGGGDKGKDSGSGSGAGFGSGSR